MNKDTCIFVAGHNGLVGSSICRSLEAQGYTHLILRDRKSCDLSCKDAVKALFAKHDIQYVFLAAAHVGGIGANSNYPGDFIVDNLLIQTHVLHEAMEAKVKRLLFLGSSCIYPAHCEQPMRENAFMTGPLEITNRPYAVAKIAGIETCWAYNKQYNTQFLAAMPTNLYGPNDNYHLDNAHVIQALIHKKYIAKAGRYPTVSLWGRGKIKREFLYADDLADACVFLMNLSEEIFGKLIQGDNGKHPIINIGYGSDIMIQELARLVKKIINFNGNIFWDANKPDGVKQKLLDSAKIQSLGWQPRYSLEEGLKLAYADFLKHYKEGTLRA